MLNNLINLRHNYWSDYWFRRFDEKQRHFNDKETRLQLIRRIKALTRLVYGIDRPWWAKPLTTRQHFMWEWLLEKAWEKFKRKDYTCNDLDKK